MVNGWLCATFWEVCIANEFLEDDQKWMICFTEVSYWATEQVLWLMFVSVLQHDNMTEPAQLWNWFVSDICSDLLYWIKQQMDNVSVDLKNAHWDFSLHLIAQDLARYRWILNDFNMSDSVLF